MASTLSISGEKSAVANDRRRRMRLPGETLGWLLPPNPRMAMHLPDDEEGWEVLVYDISRFGVGFDSTQSLKVGEQLRLRIGRGPIKRSRLIRVVVCRQSGEGTWNIGAEFVGDSARLLARAG